MDEIARLEREIASLQRQLEKQSRDAEKKRQNIANENLKKLRAYEARMQKDLDRHDKNVQKEYEKLLKEYQKSIDKSFQEEKLALDADYQRLLADTRQKESEWKQKTEELDQLVANLKMKSQTRNEKSLEEAQRHFEEAKAELIEVNGKPHEKFAPKQVEVYHRTIKEAAMLAKSGLYEAAIAIFISARSGLRRLGFDIDEEYRDWARLYDLYKDKVLFLHTMMIDELSEWFSFAENRDLKVENASSEDRDRAGKSINYWSCGVYGDLSNRLAAFGMGIGKAEKESIPVYLKKENSISSEELEKRVKELDEMETEFVKVQSLYKERYKASCERADWGESIIDFFCDEINLTWLESESGYRETDPETEDTHAYTQYMLMQYGNNYDRVDTREWLGLVFSNAIGTEIFIYIVPYEKGLTVENRIILYVDFTGSSDDSYSRQILSHICECLGLADDEIISFADDVDELKANINPMLRETGRSIETRLRREQRRT